MALRFACILALVLPVSAGTQGEQLHGLVGRTFQARVVTVVDGDTVDVVRTNNPQKLRIRLEGIDCPESGEPFSRQATNLTRVLAFDQSVMVEGRDVDRYDRLVARIRVGFKDVSIELVAAGLACHYRQYSSDPALARAEADAKLAGRGFWASDAQKPPCAAREATAAPKSKSSQVGDGKFIGNVQSRVYHASACRNATCKNCTRVFGSRAEAEAAGFRPAGDCLR